MAQNSLKKLEIWKNLRTKLKALLLVYRFPRAAQVLRNNVLGPLMPENETRLNSWVRHSFSMTGGAMLDAEDIRATRHVYQNYLDHITGVIQGKDSGKPVVWAEFGVSNEILRAFDCVPYIPESLAIMAHNMGTDATVRLVEEAENAGVPVEYCSAAKAAIGAFMLDQTPEPDCIISSSHPCDSIVSSYQTIQYITGKPLFVLDTPYWDDARSDEYYAQNLWDMIAFLEKTLCQKMDWDKLRTLCENLNAMNQCLMEYTELSRAVPSPASFMCLLLAWQHSIASQGTPGTVAYAREILANAKERLNQGKAFLKEENIRVIWWDIPLAFHFMEPWLNRTFGAATVADFMGRVQTVDIDTSSEEAMVRGLARMHLNIAMVRQCRGPAEFLTGEFKRVIEEFPAHCCIFTRHQGCKGGWAMGKVLRDICKKADLPALFLSTDSFDKRCCPEDQIKKEITEFFEAHSLA